MKAPSSGRGDFCAAHRAESALFMPEIAKSLSTPKRLQHVIPFAFFEVGVPNRIVRVGFAFDLNVALNGYATREQQPQLMQLPFFITGFPEEDPVTVPLPLKVSVFEPARAFFRMSSSCPLPQLIEDQVIHAIERAFAHYMPVVICPAPYFGVEFINQVGGRPAQCGFDCFPDASQEAFDIFLGGLYEQFPIWVSAHVLSKKVKALRHVRDDCLRGRKFKASLP